MQVNLQLLEHEHEIIKQMIKDEVERLQKIGGDVFYITKIVNLFQKIENTNKHVPLVPASTELVVEHGAPDTSTLPVKTTLQADPIKEKRHNVTAQVVVTDVDVTPDNIDDLAGAMIQEDSDNEEVVVEKPRK